MRGSGGSEYLASLVEVSASFSLACFSFSLFPSLIFALPHPPYHSAHNPRTIPPPPFLNIIKPSKI